MFGEAVTFIWIAVGLIAVPEAAATVNLPVAFPWAMIRQFAARAAAGTSSPATTRAATRIL